MLDFLTQASHAVLAINPDNVAMSRYYASTMKEVARKLVYKLWVKVAFNGPSREWSTEHHQNVYADWIPEYQVTFLQHHRVCHRNPQVEERMCDCIQTQVFWNKPHSNKSYKKGSLVLFLIRQVTAVLQAVFHVNPHPSPLPIKWPKSCTSFFC